MPTTTDDRKRSPDAGTMNGMGPPAGPAARQILPLTAPPAIPPPRQDATPAAASDKAVRLRVSRLVALRAIAVLITIASAACLAESYRGLWLWARHHGFSGFWAAAFPAQIDVFIAVGELALFVALADALPRRSRVGAWTVTLAGLAVSVAGNVGHVASHDIASRVTAGVPPVAATVALAVGLGVLKRVVEAGRQDDTTGNAPIACGTAGNATGSDTGGDTDRDNSTDRKAPPRRPRQRQKTRSGSDKVRDILSGNPGLAKADVARRAGVSVRTVERVISMTGTAGSDGHSRD